MKKIAFFHYISFHFVVVVDDITRITLFNMKKHFSYPLKKINKINDQFPLPCSCISNKIGCHNLLLLFVINCNNNKFSIINCHSNQMIRASRVYQTTKKKISSCSKSNRERKKSSCSLICHSLVSDFFFCVTSIVCVCVGGKKKSYLRKKNLVLPRDLNFFFSVNQIKHAH